MRFSVAPVAILFCVYLATTTVSGEPEITGFDPEELSEGQELGISGVGLDSAIGVTGLDWRGSLVEFSILEATESEITVEVPAIHSSWRNEFVVPILVETAAGATYTLPSDLAVVEGFASDKDFNSRAFRVTSGSSLSVTGGSGGLFVYVEEGASLSYAGTGGGHVFVAENGSTASFSEGIPGGLLLAGEETLLSGVDPSANQVHIFPSISPSTEAGQPAIYPTPDFDLPGEDEAVLGRSFAKSIPVHRVSHHSLQWEITGLPEGLRFSGSDDAAGISGIPEVAGSYSIHLTASMDFGTYTSSKTATMTLTVIDEGVPVISGGAALEIGAGEEITLQIEATETPVNFGAEGLPPGLTVDPETGLISGAATEPGAYTVTLSATNPNGTGEGFLTILVDQAPLHISGFSPESGVGGDTVVINGTGFTGTERVLFRDWRNDFQEAMFTVLNDTELAVELPVIWTSWHSEFRSRIVVVTETAASLTTAPESAPESGPIRMQVVEPGETYTTGGGGSQTVYLRAGSTGFLSGGGGGHLIFVEEGASLEINSDGGGHSVLAARNAELSGEIGSVDLVEVPQLERSALEALFTLYPLPLIETFSDHDPLLTGSTGEPFEETFYPRSPTPSALEFAAEDLPPGLEILGTDFELTISGIPEFGGVFEATVYVTNEYGTTAKNVTFDITDDGMPKFKPVGQVQVETGEPIYIQIEAVNPPDLFEAEGLPDGLSFNPFSGEFFGELGEPGFYEFTVSAANRHGEDRMRIQIQAGTNPLTIFRLPDAAPEGSWIDAQGMGFSDVTAVFAVDPWRNSIRETDFVVENDRLLSLLVPNDFPHFRDRGVYLAVVTPQAAVVTISPGHREVTATDPGGVGGDHLVRSGGRIEGGGGGVIAYLEEGAELTSGGGGYLVFAEQGSTAQISVGSGHAVIFATGSSIIGDPSYALEVPSIRYALVEPLMVQPVPQIVGSTEVKGYLNLPFTYQVNTGHVHDETDLEYGAADLPPGLEIDSETGLVYGRPEAAGEYSSWLEVANGYGTNGALLHVSIVDPFEEWTETNFAHLQGGSYNPLAAPEAESFDDGYNNLARYGFVLDPSEPATGHTVTEVYSMADEKGFALNDDSGKDDSLPSSSPATPLAYPSESSAGNGVLFSYRRIRADGLGDAVTGYSVGSVKYIAEVSTDLRIWRTGPEYLEQVGEPIDNGDGSETVTLRPRDGTAGVLFFRVRIERSL